MIEEEFDKYVAIIIVIVGLVIISRIMDSIIRANLHEPYLPGLELAFVLIVLVFVFCPLYIIYKT